MGPVHHVRSFALFGGTGGIVRTSNNANDSHYAKSAIREQFILNEPYERRIVRSSLRTALRAVHFLNRSVDPGLKTLGTNLNPF